MFFNSIKTGRRTFIIGTYIYHWVVKSQHNLISLIFRWFCELRNKTRDKQIDFLHYQADDQTVFSAEGFTAILEGRNHDAEKSAER